MCDVNEYVVSSLAKTWIFDLDGTLLKHNGYKIDGVADTIFVTDLCHQRKKIDAENKVKMFTF